MKQLFSFYLSKLESAFILTMVIIVFQPCILSGQDGSFTMEDILSYPFPNELSVAANGAKMVWAINKNGSRNLFGASSPDFQVRQLTPYEIDDGQELSSVAISNDGNWVVYVRGGDFGSNWDDAKPVNPRFYATPPAVQILSVPFDGGQPVVLGEGEQPVISPDNKEVAFVKDGQIWAGLIDGSAPATKLFHTRGSNGSIRYSPDGSRLAFVSNRGDHAFIGIYTDAEMPIQWVSPSFHRDESPRWSRDGQSIAYVRRPGRGGSPSPILKAEHSPWSIHTYHFESTKNMKLWEAPETLRGSYPTTHGRTNLHWANGYIIFLSYHDGWPHLYSIPEGGGEPSLLTPGNYMAEYISMSHDGDWLVFCGNTGPDSFDIDRRHIVRARADGSQTEVLTTGTGNEWTPFITGNGIYMAYISAGPKRPPTPAIMHLATGKSQLLGEELIPPNFPDEQMVIPSQVIFRSKDGTPVHATLFKSNDEGPKPAIIYIHGGPPRQMLLGWHYSSYYSNAYAVNQYLASQGYLVLSVNYRLGIGYGYEFHRPPDGGWRGASEYQDILAAGEWLAQHEMVDTDRIGVYGGSYGGYLTAMALARDSDLFAAGVDIHGVHDRTVNRTRSFLLPDQYEKAADAEYALEVAWASSPVSDVETWKSPVLIIHADDDRNVAFSQSTDLVRRLNKKGVETETLVIVDDTHHFMMHANQLKVNKAVADFFNRKFMADEE